MAKSMPKSAILLVNLSGRGDKDMQTAASRLGLKL
jgi:tryptophan synthase beta subunit